MVFPPRLKVTRDPISSAALGDDCMESRGDARGDGEPSLSVAGSGGRL
jgi:hypothetical protein